MKKIDLTGERFGRLFVIKEAKTLKHKRIAWECICDCGLPKTITGKELRSGHTKSCGCLHNEILANISRVHGMHGIPEYWSWSNMIQRCTNKKHPKFSDYGGRGIKVCKEWRNSFATFYRDMGPMPKGLTIERKNNESGYFKTNCVWDSRTMQARNRRKCKTNQTGVTGVHWDNRDKKYIAQIGADGRQYNLGYFSTIEAAKKARIIGEQKYWGKDASSL